MTNKYDRVYGGGLNKYYMVGGSIALNRTQANRMMKQQQRNQKQIDQVVDGIVNVTPVNRKKSVNFIKSLAK